MYIEFDILLTFFCCVLLLGLVVIILLVRRPSHRRYEPAGQRTDATTAPDTTSDQERQLQAAEQLLETWIVQQRLRDEVHAQVVQLLQEDRTALQKQATTPAAQPDVAHFTRPGPVSFALKTATAVQPSGTTAPETAAPATSSTPEQPAPQMSDQAAPAEATPEVSATPHISRAEQFIQSVLALRTRLTLLFLGAFLLVVSALILVIFNWASFPPILQFALLAGVCGGFWGGGIWMTRQTELEQAGRGLQIVGGGLTPIVAFALCRPGLLDLGVRDTWLLISLLSLTVYLLSAWRLRQHLFAVAACLAAASSVLAALRFVDNTWLLSALLLVLTSYLPLSNLLSRRGAPDLAAAPAWVAHAGVPLTLLATLLLRAGALVSMEVLTATLWAGAVFYLLAVWLERRPRWAWVTALLIPTALLVTLETAGLERQWLPLALLLLLLPYLPLSHLLSRRGATELARAPYGVAHAGVPLTLLAALLLHLVYFLSMELLAANLWIGLGFYLLALGLERQPRWAWVTALLLPGALLVTLATTSLERQWLPLVLLLVLTAYLPLSQRLSQRGATELARAPYRVAHAGVPLTLLLALLLHLGNLLSLELLAVDLWIGVGFYLLSVWLERQPHWAWITAALIPGALVASLATSEMDWSWHGLALALLALAYLGGAWLLDPRHKWYALPGYAGTAVLTGLALVLALTDVAVTRWTFPVLILVGVGTVLAYHRGRLAWLTAEQRLTLATTGLLLAAALPAFWLLALLDLTNLSYAQRGLWLLPLAVGYFVGAYHWPGRLRRPYDWTLQTLGALTLFGVGGVVLPEPAFQAGGMALVTLIWIGQTLRRRRPGWAALALGHVLLTAGLYLPPLRVLENISIWLWAALGFTIVYAVGGTLLRQTSWRYWSWPGIGWAGLTGLATLQLLIIDLTVMGEVVPRHVLALFVLALLFGLMTWLWRLTWLGYPAALLLVPALLLLAWADFFIGWELTIGDYGYLLCGFTLGLALLGQGIRRVSHGSPGYAYPYEVVGFALLTLAPLPASVSPQYACLTWTAMMLLYGLATWRYQLPWLIAPAFVAMDMALLHGAGWLSPGGRPAEAGLLLLGAAWVQAWTGFWAYRQARAAGIPARKAQQSAPDQPGRIDARLVQVQTMALPSFTVAGLSSLGALTLASGDSTTLTIVALGLALLLALFGTLEQRVELAWSAVLLGALSMISLNRAVGLELEWGLAWGVLTASGLCLLGWGIAKLNQQVALHARVPGLAIWQQPLTAGPLIAGLGLSGLLLLRVVTTGELPALTFGLVNLALLLTTLSVRRHIITYAYGAGAALVGAGICQLYTWGFHDPQWYVVPAGIYLLALAEGLRHFQGQHQLSRMIEMGALMVLLGITLGQSLRTEGIESLSYGTWLCIESLLVLGYGMQRKLRVPFLGGILFFILGVLWLSIDPLLAANKWLLLGALGLLLVGVYVLLERRQERLLRTGRIWFERVSSWG